jgi:hypothetical protein
MRGVPRGADSGGDSAPVVFALIIGSLRRASLRARPTWRYTEPMSRDFHLHRTPVDVLNYEIVQEQAAALGRMGRTLEAALARLWKFDATHQRSGAPASTQQARRTLVTEAGHALWMFVVQREACGLRDSRTVMRDYNVPGEVQQCMGLAPAASLRAVTA